MPPDLYKICKNMPPGQWRDFMRFLDSPWFNTSEFCRKLGEFLSEHQDKWRNEPHAVLSKANIYITIWGKEEYVDQRFRRLMMEFRALLKRFLAESERSWGHSALREQLTFLNWSLRTGDLELFNKTLRKTEQIFEKFPLQDEMWLFHRYQLERIRNDYHIQAGKVEDTFDEESELLTRFYLATSYQLQCSKTTREQMFPQKHVFNISNWLDDFEELKPDWDETELWKQLYALVSGQLEEAEWPELEARIDRQAENMIPETLRQMHGYMLNAVALRANQTRNFGEVHRWCRKMEAAGTLFLEGKLTPPFFQVAVRSALRADAAAWAAEFIRRNRDRVTGTDSRELLASGRLSVWFEQGRYREVLRGVRSLKFHNPRYDVLVRVLELKARFERGDFDDVVRLAEAFRKYISRREGLGEAFFRNYQNFGLVAGKLGKLTFAGKAAAIPQIEIPPETAEKDWLLSKITA